MKSNVIMTRPLGKFEVYQRTKDGMFNATSLLAQWNKAKNSNKRIQDFFENQNTKDFIEALMEEENLKVPNLASFKNTRQIQRRYMDAPVPVREVCDVAQSPLRG